MLNYVVPRLQVVSTERAARVDLALEVRREGSAGIATPRANQVLHARRDEGQGQLAEAIAVTDARGVARFRVDMPAVPDRTRLTVWLDGDERSFLPFEVVVAPVVPIDLAAGEAVELPVASDGALLRFPDHAGAAYVVMPFQTDLERGGSSYRLRFAGRPGARQVGGAGLDGPPLVRTRRPEAAADGHVAAGAIEPGGLEAATAIQMSLSIRSCLIEVDREAPLRYLGDRIALYVDAPVDRYEARIDSIGRAFDESIYNRNSDLFGPTTDEDGNGRVLVVLTPELKLNGGVYCDTIRTIGVEAFYGNWSPTDPIDRPLSTLAHEHQHVINAGLHLRTDGAIGDERWLNEGMSYAAEALHGYWGGALVRMWAFMSGQNNGMSMLPLDYAPAFNDEYMMFLLYLRDRFGSGTYRVLGISGRKGIANVEAVTGQDIETILTDWFLANAVAGLPIADDPRYRYASVDLLGMEDEIAACSCVPGQRFNGMNFEPLVLDGAFDVGRMLDGADADYYAVEAGPEAGGGEVDLYFDAFGTRAVRLAVVRRR